MNRIARIHVPYGLTPVEALGPCRRKLNTWRTVGKTGHLTGERQVFKLPMHCVNNRTAHRVSTKHHFINVTEPAERLSHASDARVDSTIPTRIRRDTRFSVSAGARPLSMRRVRAHNQA